MTKYKAIARSGTVDAEDALIQAARSLDAAALAAENVQDVEGLMNVAAMWMKLSQDFEAFAQGVARMAVEYTPKSDTQLRTGFQKSDIIIEEEKDA